VRQFAVGNLEEPLTDQWWQKIGSDDHHRQQRKRDAEITAACELPYRTSSGSWFTKISQHAIQAFDCLAIGLLLLRYTSDMTHEFLTTQFLEYI
jgi:hypothetical protein